VDASEDETIDALRGDVALQIARATGRGGVTQTEAAKRLGIPQPTLSKIVNGRVEDISLELLIRIAVRAGLPLALQTGRGPEEAGAFRTLARQRAPRSTVDAAARESRLLAEQRLTPTQRLEAFLEHNQLLAELHRSGRAASASNPSGESGGE